MNFLQSSALSFALLAAAAAVGGCSQPTDEPSTSAAAVSSDGATCKAMEAYNQAVKNAQDTLQADYTAAMDTFNKAVADAGAKRDAALAALPNTDDSAQQYNEVIVEYNAEVGPSGPLVEAYNAAVKAAQDKFNATVQTALDAYNAHPCMI